MDDILETLTSTGDGALLVAIGVFTAFMWRMWGPGTTKREEAQTRIDMLLTSVAERVERVENMVRHLVETQDMKAQAELIRLLEKLEAKT